MTRLTLEKEMKTNYLLYYQFVKNNSLKVCESKESTFLIAKYANSENRPRDYYFGGNALCRHYSLFGKKESKLIYFVISCVLIEYTAEGI